MNNNEEFDLIEIIVTWICYSVVLVCSFLISESIHIVLGVGNTLFGTFSIIVVTQFLTIMYRIIFEKREITLENILKMNNEAGLDLIKFLLICLIFFGVFKLPITILNCIAIICLFTIILMFI